ncbi:MAG: hypothetical protein ACXVRM_09905 [Solirubrobacteraceae bacterium]
MFRLRTLTALAVTAVSLSAMPAAFGKTSTVGNSSGLPNANICLLSFDCTYVNYRYGKPTDVVKHSGTLVSWSLNATSLGGATQLRILHPVGHGKFKFVHSSAIETILGTDQNTFSTHIKVRAGDVLALTNATSGLYMTTAPAGTCVRYFDSSRSDGSTGKPNRVWPQLRLLLSAKVKY